MSKSKRKQFRKHQTRMQHMHFNSINQASQESLVNPQDNAAPYDHHSAFLRYLMELCEDDVGSSYLTKSLEQHQSQPQSPSQGLGQSQALASGQGQGFGHGHGRDDGPNLKPNYKELPASFTIQGAQESDFINSDVNFQDNTMSNIHNEPTIKSYGLFVLSLLTCIFVMYQSISAAMADDALNDLISMSGNDYQLSVEDRKVLDALSKANNPKSAKSQVSRPYVSDATSVRFVYGASRPNLVCSLLHVCDIALEPNETVVDLKVGDSTRWIIERSASGSPQGMIEHIAVKPTDIGLQSNLRIYTDKRTYYLDLSSSDKEFMPQISFIYPEQALQNFAQIKSDLIKTLKTRTINPNSDQDPVLIDNLDFSYSYSGDESLYPIRTFNDGKKTYLQMPDKLMNSTLPALVVVHNTHLFGDDDIAVTNYRIKDNKFIIDGLPEHIRLLLGNQDNGVAKSADIRHKS